MMTKNKLAFVLSGGGSRGALQVGAIQALIEAGLNPGLVTGTSIGSINGAFLSIHGFTPEGLKKLRAAWLESASQDLLPTNLWWHFMRTFLRRHRSEARERVREFAIQNGIKPDLRFADLVETKLYIIATDLNSGCQVIFGENPEDLVLDSMLASIALPPWMTPLEKGTQYLMDGGAVSNLPVEAALRQGAEEIVALDLFNPYEVDRSEQGLRPFLWKLNQAVESRQVNLELDLARARGIPVHHIPLVMENPIPFWDFRHSAEMIEEGYRITSEAVRTLKLKPAEDPPQKPGLLKRIEGFLRREDRP